VTGNDTLEIVRGTNPDIIFEFFTEDTELSPRLNLEGAVISVATNIEGYAPLGEPVDMAQGIIAVPMPEQVTLDMKTFTDYYMRVRAVDVTGKIHMATLNVTIA
jgi:hypothetical protein